MSNFSLQCHQMFQKLSRKNEFSLIDRVWFGIEISELHYVNNEMFIKVGASIKNVHQATALILIVLRQYMIIHFVKILID